MATPDRGRAVAAGRPYLRRVAAVLIPLPFLLGIGALAQGVPSGNPDQVGATGSTPKAEWCQLKDDGANAALKRACERVIADSTRLPDYLCERTVKRTGPTGYHPPTQIVAQVRYVNGKESYADVKVNGQCWKIPLQEMPGLTSMGEFGSILLDLFDPKNHAEFELQRITKVDSRNAILFKFRVQQKDNKSLWPFSQPGWSIYPGYEGRLWLEEATAQPIRLEMHAEDLPDKVTYKEIKLSVEYAEISLGDGSKFVLPVNSDSVICNGIGSRCYRNSTTFTKFRKFAAEHRILPPE